MAGTLLGIIQTAETPDFRNRVKAAMIKTAILIVGEAQTGNKQTLLEKRHELGVGILNTPDAYTLPFAFAVASNPVITTESLDGDIEFTVVSVYNDLAGVKNSES